MSRLTQSQVEQDARTLLDEVWDSTKLPIDVDAIAGALDAQVRRRPNSPDISGLLYKQDDEVIIGVNADDAHVRQRFTIAHEIGHLRLHKSSGFFVDRAYRASKHADVDSDPHEEREANWFAAELLMPADHVRRVAGELLAQRSMTDEALIGALAEKFAVSRQAMSFRVLNLGLVSGL